MFTLKAAKGCSIVPRIHKFYLTNSNRARQHPRPETSSFRDLLQGRSTASKWVAIEREVHKEPSATEITQNLRRKSREESLGRSYQTQQPDATTRHNNPVATIQSQGVKLKAGRFLTTGTRRKHRNAAFQLNRTTSHSSLDWFLKSTAGNPVATFKTRRLTQSNDVTAPTSSIPVDATQKQRLPGAKRND
ncbi:hypothetical protein F511_15941 [Dorcoceras hygrometricum]|uniref:Uncharacterized protein n=1 Tax=Dorcoceras hygrometricum TaxID=472368 RepID=A0A2Z7C2Z1_9LAMI|nr:hypothetical protein F511_15941 [Dorcoceras hygrometricum]